VRIYAIATDTAIDRVVFFVDGEEAGSDGRPPFSFQLELDPESGPTTLRAVALDRKGRPLGEHALTLGGSDRPFEVAIRGGARLPATAAGGAGREAELEVEVEVSVPPGARLDGVDLYRNQELVARLREPPFRARFSLAEPHDEGYVRAVARLADGRTREDARPLTGPGTTPGPSAGAADTFGERLEINLVEVFAVATGRAGGAVNGLAPSDFQVFLAGRELPIESFREARQVPLTLGLLVDSSTSMRAIMEKTREAAGRFLERVLARGDRGFLVDVDTRPRLAHELTADPEALADAFARLEADGDTALYDSMTLGLIELRRHLGRRALVVLTDGEDSSSFLGLGHCLELARRSGVPIYLVSVGGLDERKTHPDRNLRLEAFARDTGGRLYPVTSRRELDRAYDEIGAELRSQYVLGVAADRALTAAELAGLEVEARDRRVRVRATTRATAN
jgi:Ca-activated chloride channel family protein